jgi:hypothetical protein
MISRRLALAGSSLAALSPTAHAQATDLLMLAPDRSAGSLQVVSDIVNRLGGSNSHLHAEAGRGILDSAARLADRQAAVAAVLPSISPTYMERSGVPGHVVYANRFIARLGVSELHVLASQRVTGLSDLTGQKVNIGPQGSATQATAEILLNRLTLRFEPQYLDHDQALAAVLQGQIAAMLLLAPKPAPLLSVLKPPDGVRLIPITLPGGLPGGLLPAQILPTDYPNIPGSGAVKAIGVPMLLTCFNWSPKIPMFNGLVTLSDLLIAHGSGLEGYDLEAEVPGWERFPPVADWLEQGRTGTVTDVVLGRHRPPPVDPPVKPRPAPASPPPLAPPDSDTTTTQKEKLFQQFLNWRRAQ